MKKLILLFSLMAICAFAFADTYIIGTGTSTTYYCPFNGLWDYSWSKAIWTAAELTAAGLPADTPIIGIGFYVGNTPSNYTMLDQRIYVRTTTLTSYSTATDETGTGYPNPAYFLNLFQGDLTYNGSGWHYITFETPVSWDGTSNLELLFENWDGDYVTGYPTFCYTSTSPDYRTVYKSQDNSFPAVAGTRSYNRPNVAIITPSTTPPGAPVLSAPADGATLVSITPTFSWTAPTTGGLPTGYKVYLGESPDLTDADIIADVTGLSYTVPSSNPLQYNHTYYWTVVAYNDNGNGPQADVRSFTTLEEGYITIGTGTSTQRQPFGVYFGYERSAALYTNDQIGGYGLLDEVAWNCATTSTANVPYKIYVMQTNDTALTAMTWDAFTTNATLVAEGTHTFDTTGWHLFELGIPFPYTAGNLIVAVETNYGGSGTSSYPYFYYSTGAAGSHQYWNQDTNPPTGNGYINTNLPNIMLHLGALPEEPVISVSPSSWDFGLTVINTTKTKIFTISNAGAGTLTVNNITIAGDYYTLQINPDNPLPISLDVGQIATFTVQFAPTAVGDFTGAVTIDSNAGTAIVNLTGQCYDPTIYTFPYTQDFEIWPPLGWDLTGGSHSFTQYTDTYGNNWARANFWSQSSGSTDILTSPPLHPTSTPIMNFTWSHLYSSSYPNDALTVQISSDLSTWTDLWYKAGTDLNSNDGAANMAPGTGVIETINIPSSYNNTTFWIRFYAYSGYGPDLFIDNVVISTPSGPPEPVTLTYPANGATDLPQVGFNLTWTPATTGGAPDYYAVYMSQSEETIYGDYYWETTNTSFNPVTDPVPPEIPVQFDYNQRWFWTVEAVNDDGGAVVEPPYMFTIAPHPGVLGVNPSSLTQTLTIPDNITATRQLTLSNTGELPLNYRVKIEETTERRNSITPIEQINPPAHLNPDWTGYNEKSPFIGPVVESEARALFDVQFIYPTYMNQGEYGIATDGTYFYTANWGGNNIYGFNKYALDGTYIETFTITGVPGIRDLAYDGTYFYGAAVSTTIYKMDFNTHTLVGTLTCPVSARGIAYDEDNDAFWVSNNWAADLRLINRSGNQLAAVTPAVAAFAGLAYDNFSGTNPTIWGNTQNGTYGATLVQIDISTGATLQSLEITEAILPGITTDDIAGGLEIYPNIVNGKVSLIPLMQNWCFYGLELCDIENWLSVEPKSGTINPGETPTVNVTFDASDLDLGTYTANIKFNHNGENTPVVVPVTLTVGGTYPAVFSITPDVAYNFGTIEQLNPAVKTFTITNTGGSSPTPLTIDVDGIYLTNDAEHNFVIDAPNLPVSLGHNETYQFTVSFIPQTIGNKTATLNIQDNLTSKVLHTVALSGTAVAEHIFIPVNLTATVREQDVSLSWASYSGIPGSPGWLHYDNGENYDAIGTGDVGTFEVAIRFDSGTMYGYAGMELTKVKYFPRSANTAYTIKVWTGNDGTYTPSTLVYSQTHTPIVNQWNEVELNTHIPITGTQALWIGYECVVSTGTDYYPAGCDAGPAVVGYGDLISLGTWESMAIGYGLNYNWNLQGYFEVSEGGKAPQLLSIPVINQEQRSKEHMAIRFTTSGNSNPPTRVLRGYNIYRDEMQINTELVPTTTYTDHLVPYGTHTYTVQGVYYSALSPMSNPVVVNVTPPVPYPLPFVETWASGDFTTNQWNASATNWLIDDYEGMEPPCACFYWSPRLTNYQEYLTSWYLDANGIPNVKFKFDMELDNYSTTTENLLIPQVWDGTTWHTIHTFSSLDNQGDGLPWDTYEYDISAYAGNRMFRIRFLAAGGDTYDINDWYIDNIVLEAIQVILPPTPAITFDGTYVKLTWEPVSGANGYKIWAASDPYATEWTELAYIAGTTYTYTGTDNIKFFKVTAVTEVPVKGVNDLRTREITPSNHSIKTDKGLSPKKEKQIKQ